MGPSWVVYTLFDAEVDHLMEMANWLSMEADRLEHLVFMVTDTEEEDMLRYDLIIEDYTLQLAMHRS